VKDVPLVFEVFQDNWEVVKLFLRLITQWRYSQGVRLGLNYQSIEFLFRAEKINSDEWSDYLDGIQIMEMKALEAFRDKEKK
jgi:hypothetical protein